ncbi:hypothetical protein [Brachyspira sp. SAP_772]|uniref:hypothetical protein n=1 Tax=Brachyspira sp. SAP_772 TaxID=2608385 RepID=UPI0012F5160A|nr:hypothetical protein [Brachyspira sp. SAP_772]
MKNKIYLILIVIAFIISCSNNNTNPNNGKDIKDKTELGNVETPTNDGSGSSNNGSSDNNTTDNNRNNTTEKPTLPPLENYLYMYSGVAKYYVKTLDDAVVTKPTDENIYVEIYDDNSIVVSSGATFFFNNVQMPSSNVYQSTEYYNDVTYKLELTLNNDGTATLRLSIRDSQYSYHFDADKLTSSK